MLSKEAIFYYRQILVKYPNSYIAQDLNKTIIGIDCEFLDANNMDFSEFKAKFYAAASKEKLCEYAGFFGVFSANFISLFEDLAKCEKKNYDFPLFLFANARAYLVYENNTKMYFKFGSNDYFDYLCDDFEFSKKGGEFKIENNLEEEAKDYEKMLLKARDYLLSGDIFQVVLSKQLCITHNINALEYYEKLCELNASAYMFYFPSSYGVVLGSSPELVLRIKNKELFVAPIAGTRNITSSSNLTDLEADLLSDEKELSEHKMLVDLARNDISKFGENTRVEELFSVLKSKFVMHLVSSVYADLKKDASIFDAITAVFPAGTLSGAPKIRALQIIAELERLDRGVYGGAVGFLHFNENVSLAIIIRSAFFKEDKAFIASGAGIVLASNETKEYAEILAKRRALIVAFEELANLSDKRGQK